MKEIKDMGIFGGGYTKPGKGVDKNEPKKKGFFLFFDILIHKASKFIGANCLYTITSIIWIAVLYFFAGILLTGTSIVSNISAAISAADGSIDPAEMRGSIMVLLQLAFAVGIFSLWGSGPASAAYAYVTRCFTRGEPVWVISDGWDKLKENFAQGILAVLFDAVILVFGLNAIHFYYSFYVSTQSAVWLLLSYIMLLVLVVYTMMHPYIYQIMVTFECKIWAVYKNALLITLAKLPGNVFTLLVGAAVLFLLFTVLNPVAASLIVVMAGLCLVRYPGEFYAARVIERSILKGMKEKKPKIEYIGEEE